MYISMKKKGILISIACVASLVAAAQMKNTPQLGVASVKEVIAAMTLEEKIELIHGTGMGVSVGTGPVAGSVGGPVPGAAGLTYAIPRLGIPSIVMADGPAGLRIDTLRTGSPKRYYTTAFPTGTIQASTWNTELMKEVGRAMGNEVKEYGVDILLAPGVNIQRNLLCGRNYEYYSEDPLLTGMIGAAFTKGVQENGVGVSVKHFAANNQETNRNYVSSTVSRRALREIYLKAFEMIVREAAPWTIMSAYNKINGQYASESKDLLTTVLRDEWGFDGMVMTDWFAGKNYPGQLLAGNDLLMPGRKVETKRVKEALAEGTIKEADIDKNVERILNLILRCPTLRKYKYSDTPDLKAHALVARRAAEEGIVMLKNEGGVLPLKPGKVAVLGNAAYETYIGGTGSGEVSKAYYISIVQGLGLANYEVDTAVKEQYLKYIEAERAKQPERTNILQRVNTLPEMVWSEYELAMMAKKTEAAVITIGRNAGEGADRNVEGDYELKASEKALIRLAADVFHAEGKKVVVILNIDGVVEVASWRNYADAILTVWLPGQEGGHAVAGILSGKVNPSGKLPVTFPMTYTDVPSSPTFPGEPANRPDSTVYNEGVYVGYRYANTFGVEPAYEFGFGLSYTTFRIGNLKLNTKTFKDEIRIRTTVKNTGDRAGKEVVQLYLSAPNGSMEKPQEELKGFVKTRLLQPGEEQEVTFIIKAHDLASFNTETSCWTADAGVYTAKVGNSSRNILQTASFKLGNQLVTQRVHDVLVPRSQIKELSKNHREQRLRQVTSAAAQGNH